MRLDVTEKLLGYGIAVSVLVGIFVTLYCIDPAGASIFPPCPFHLLTGQYCPGCGSLRAIHRLLHGQLVAALRLNPLMVVSIPFLGLMFISSSWMYKRWMPYAAIGMLICYGVARNIPVWPFALLAP